MTMATIMDVAKRARVSKATVSRVLNGIPVKEETRRKVVAAMKELDYRPNAQARSLTSGKTQVVGVLVPDIESAFYGPILEGCQQSLLSRGYNMLVCSTYHKRGNEYTFAKLLWEKRVDGLLILTPREVEDKPMQLLLRKFASSGFPIVVADGEFDNSLVPAVWVNNFEGGYKATEHLLKLGHKRIGLLLGPKDAPEASQRHLGYQQALRDYGITPCEELVVCAGNYLVNDGLKVAGKLLAKQPTAIFATSDDLAISVLEVGREMGICVPQDLSLVGYDDVAYAQLVTPKLTTVRQPLKQLGSISARKLVQTITGEEPEIAQITLPTELVIRDSTTEVTNPSRHDHLG